MTPSSNSPKNGKMVRDIRADALKITNSIKVDGQSKVDTAAIAHGIQRGMELFLRQQSEKTRDLNRRVKKVKQLSTQITQTRAVTESHQIITTPASRLPWILLGMSWLLFLVIAVYVEATSHSVF